MIDKKLHLTSKGYAEILSIRAAMNLGLSEKLTKTLEIPVKPRPTMKTEMPNEPLND
jgi:hypothetical protein